MSVRASGMRNTSEIAGEWSTHRQRIYAWGMRSALSIMVVVGLMTVSASAPAQEPRTASTEGSSQLSAPSPDASASCTLPSNPYEDSDETRNPYLVSSEQLDGMVEPNPYRMDSETAQRANRFRTDGCELALVGVDNPYRDDEVAIEENPYVIASFTGIDEATEPNPYY